MRRSARPGKALQVLAVAALCVVLLPGVTAGGPRGDATTPTRDVIVHLFQWPWESVAAECATHLGPAGVGAVQVSPPQEHVVLPLLHGTAVTVDAAGRAAVTVAGLDALAIHC